MTALIPTGGKRSRRAYIWHRLSVLDPGGRTNLTPSEVNATSLRHAHNAIRAAAGNLFGKGKFETSEVPSIGVVTVKRIQQ